MHSQTSLKENFICYTRSLLPGEHVFGICYRDVAFKNAWYECSNVEKAKLGGDKGLPSVLRKKHNFRIQQMEPSFVEDTQSSDEEVRSICTRMVMSKARQGSSHKRIGRLASRRVCCPSR